MIYSHFIWRILKSMNQYTKLLNVVLVITKKNTYEFIMKDQIRMLSMNVLNFNALRAKHVHARILLNPEQHLSSFVWMLNVGKNYVVFSTCVNQWHWSFSELHASFRNSCDDLILLWLVVQTTSLNIQLKLLINNSITGFERFRMYENVVLISLFVITW